jgi:hypothetical protein
MMNATMTRIAQGFRRGIEFVSNPISRIFGLSDDNYPKTGVQPYSGSPSHDR